MDELEEKYLWTNNVKTPSTRMVRVYNADEVDAAIAELKARIQLDDDEMAGFLDLEEECGGDLRNYIAELKADNTIVDALCREHRQQLRSTRRALWLARANSARNSYLKWNLFANFESEEKLFTIDEYDETPGVTDFSTLRTYEEWYKVWQNVERKCRAKAEEYK